MSEYNTSDSKRIHHHNEWNLTLMVMVQMQTTIHTAAETTTVVAIRMVAAEVGTVTLANPETTTDRHSLRQLRRLRHPALQPHQQTMQLSTLSTTVQVRIHMPPMVDTKTILPTINTMLNSRHSRKAKQRLHHLEVKALLRRLRVPQVLRRRHLVDRAMAPCRLRQDCERSFAFGVSLDQGWKIWSSIVSHHLPSALRRVGIAKLAVSIGHRMFQIPSQARSTHVCFELPAMSTAICAGPSCKAGWPNSTLLAMHCTFSVLCCSRNTLSCSSCNLSIHFNFFVIATKLPVLVGPLVTVLRYPPNPQSPGPSSLFD